MNELFEKFLKITFDNNKTSDYLSDVEKKRYEESVIRMMEMQKLLKKSVEISKTAEIPLGLIKDLEGIIQNFIESKNLLDKIPNSDINHNNIFNRIQADHVSFFEPSSSNRAMMIINAVNNYESFFDKNSIKRLDELNTELDNKNKRVDEILSRLEKPSTEKVLSDYAAEYKKEEDDNNKRSTRWLVTGIVTTSLFMTLLLLSIFLEWFPSKLRLDSITNGVVSSHEIINIPVLLVKALLISLIIYFIVFCFRQYSIYKHLSVINQQKKNAFDSYILFAASVGENDLEAKKVLLMSLAKTIHESVNTGFLSPKQHDQPLIQNVDIGKLLSGNFGN